VGDLLSQHLHFKPNTRVSNYLKRSCAGQFQGYFKGNYMGIMILRFTPVYGGLLALLVIFLGYRVTLFRRRESIAFGDNDGTKAMKCAVRAHANAVENIPLALLLLLMLELNQLTPWLMHVFGLTLLLSRGMHAWGLSHRMGGSKGRFHGTALTWVCIVTMAVVNILIIFSR